MGNNNSSKLKPLKPLIELPVSQIKQDMKIAVYVVATPGIYEYTKYTIPLIKEWTNRHGYSFFLIDKNLIPGLPINFTKIQVGLNLLNSDGEFDYIMHIDADAPIINLDYPIEYMIQKYMKMPTVALFSEDCFNKSDCSQPGKQNSGVFIVKNSFIGKSFLDSWKSEALTGPCKRYANVFPSCQLVLWNCVMPEFSKFVKTLPYNALNGRDGLLVNHLMKSSGIQRNRTSKDLHSQLLNLRTGIYN
jgi:hypothetical protein